MYLKFSTNLPHSIFLWKKFSKAEERRNAQNSGHGETVGDHHYDDPPLVVKKMVTLDKFRIKTKKHQKGPFKRDISKLFSERLIHCYNCVNSIQFWWQWQSEPRYSASNGVLSLLRGQDSSQGTWGASHTSQI